MGGANLFGQMPQVPAQQIVLSDISELDSEKYEQLWTQTPVAFNGQQLIKSMKDGIQVSVQQIESHFS